MKLVDDFDFVFVVFHSYGDVAISKFFQKSNLGVLGAQDHALNN